MPGNFRALSTSLKLGNENMENQKSEGFNPQTSLKILYWGLVVAGVWFALLNIQPYQKAVIFLSGGILKGVFATLNSDSGLRAVITVSWIVGAVLWVVIQIIEVLPLILFNHTGFLAYFIGASQSHKHYQIQESDDPTLKALKKTYNALPTSVVSNLETLKIFTYTVDFLICLTVYSPVRSGKITDFILYLSTGQFSKILWDNILLALITLFAVETIICLIIWVGKLAFALKEVKTNNLY